MDPPSPNPSAANADAAMPEFGVAQDLSVFDYIDHLSPLQSIIPSNLAHCFPGLSNSPVASTSSQPKEGDKTGFESRPQSFQYSVVDVPLNGDILAEPQLPVVSASESSAVVTFSENTSGSDVMVQAQPRLSSNDGCWDNEEVICPSLHPADRKVDDEPKSVHCVSSNMLNSTNPLDVEKDFMAEVDKDVNFSSMIEQASVDLGTRHATSWELVQKNKAQHASNDNKKLHADLQDQSGEPICHQNKVTGSPGFRSQNADESVSGLPVHDCSGGTFMKRSMRKLKLSDFKASEEKHGMLRSCLQFKNDMNYSKGLLSNEPGTNLQRVLIQVVPAKLTKDSYQSERSSFSYHAGKSPTVNFRKGAGFGLHLNSIAETLSIASTGTHYQGDMHYASIKPLELTYIKQTHEVQKNTEILKGVIPRNVNTKQGYEGSPGVLSNHRSSHGANTIFLNKDISTSHGANKILLNKDISTESWHGKRKLKPGNDDSFDYLKENDSKRKRTDSDATGGCKRCKCKRTRCLKLYCDCFMAGIYCAGSCSCQDCSNKPEFEELVFSTRQQIMSRNPLAFSPKIVESGSESLPNNANVIRLTPSAARHKRGCNCKKSMCFKKYCECYQAKVGCSDGCRCEGCKNIYGKRAGHSDFQEVSISRTVQGFGGTSDEHMKADTKKTFISQTDFSKLNYHELVTESLQSTQDEVSVSSSGHLPLRSLSLPDSSMTSCNENFSRSPLNSDSHDMPLSSSSNSTRQVSYECKSHSNSSEKENDLQPSYDAEGSHSPSNNFSASSGTWELKKDPGAQLSHERRVGWSRSPILLGSTKSHPTNENGCNLSEIREDEPGILCNSTPVNDVNVRSLNRRRLSPCKPLLAIHNLGSGTSNTLKCARKFILKSVPTSQAPPPVNAKKNKEQGDSDK